MKQWGDELKNLSSSFAPKSELRNDGYKRLLKINMSTSTLLE